MVLFVGFIVNAGTVAKENCEKLERLLYDAIDKNSTWDEFTGGKYTINI